MEHLEPISEAKEMATSVIKSAYDVTLNSLFMALALTVALAWYAVVKAGVKITFIGDRFKGIWALIVYAVVVTLIFTIAVFGAKKYLKKEIPEKAVVFAMTPQ
jgi:hypothetical protein